MSGKHRDKSRSERDAPSPVGASGPPEPGVFGSMTGARPLGLDEALPWDACHPSAPLSAHVDRLAPSDGASAFAQVPTSIGVRSLAAPSQPAAHAAIQGALGSTATAQSPATGDPQDPPRASKASAVGSFIRDRLSPDGLGELKAMMFDPKLALTVGQREIVSRIGRYAEVGDKSGIKRSLLDLVERVDVTSPKNATVLVQQGLGPDASSAVAQVLSAVDPTKKSVDMTQGGRVLSMLAPVLQQNGAFDWKDGMDRGWQRLNERFAHQAQGTVDIVVPPQPAGAADPQIGAWSLPADGAAAKGQPPQPGVWTTPPSGAAGQASPQVGVWNAPPAAGPGGTPADAASVGSWTVPKDAAAASGPAAGQWQLPKDPAGQAAAKAGAVGTWSTPPDGAPSGANAVGAWSVPDAAAKGGAPAAPGQWTIPQPLAKDAGAGGPTPIGQWATGRGGDAPATVGEWHIGNAAVPQAAAASGSPSPAPIASASAAQPTDVTLAGGVKLSDLVRTNANISAVRYLQMATSAGQPSGLRELLTVGSSLLRQHFSG